jgi:hypothetical protein
MYSTPPGDRLVDRITFQYSSAVIAAARLARSGRVALV